MMGRRCRSWVGIGVLAAAVHALEAPPPDARFQWDGPALSEEVFLPWTEGASASLAGGDFDGDGREEVAIFLKTSTGEWELALIPGGDDRGDFSVSASRGLRVLFPAGDAMRAVFADMDGDGRRELIVAGEGTVPRVWGIRGRTLPAPARDFRTEAPDFEIRTGSACLSLAAGDVNGDGREDLLLGSPADAAWGRAYLVWGRAPLPPLIDAASGGAGPVFLGSRDNYNTVRAGIGLASAMADVNGDGFQDIFISEPFMSSGFCRYGGVTFGFWGGDGAWPAVWDLTGATVPLRIASGCGAWHSRVQGSGEVDGDGRGDLWFRWDESGGRFLRLGRELSAGGAETVSSPAAGLSVPTESEAWADFDGDGRTDFFTPSYPGYVVDGWLSSRSTLTGPFAAPDWTSRIDAKLIALADTDGDGRRNLVGLVFRGAASVSAEMFVYRGYRPLWNPSVRLVSTLSGARRRLALNVDGSPAEMRLGGDIIDDLRDRWVPFASVAEVTLTNALGPKTLTAVFRDGQGRASDTATLSVDLDTSGDVETLRNRVLSEAPGEWAVTTSGGAFRATVFDVDGRRVRLLDSGARTPGVWTVRWDGRDGEGRLVPGGVYVLAVEIGGVTHRRRILCER